MVTTVKATNTGAIALHDSSTSEHGDSHAVLMLNLKVMITEEDGYSFAQCLEIDYATDGASVEDVTKRFEDGLEKMIDMHLQAFGNLDNLLQPAPSRVLMTFNDKFTRLYSQVSLHFKKVEAKIEFLEAA